MDNNDKVNIQQGKIPCLSTEVDLGITLHGGQSFRWVTSDNSYRGVFESCVWVLTQAETHLCYTVHDPSEKVQDYDKMLADYLRLDVSLQEHCKKWAEVDQHFQKSCKQLTGVRILNQSVVENLFSFICSSNNNIQRISSMVEKLCLLFGTRMCCIDQMVYYDFPTIEALAAVNVEALLKKEKFGYRAGYIANAAQKLLELGGKQWLLNLHRNNGTAYKLARDQLITLPGIGPKVADCVCLMSLGHLEAIPVDTHIFQIARAHYLPHLEKQKTVTPKVHEEISKFLRDLWGPLAGWAQAIVFCAKINTSMAPSSKKRKSLKSDNNNSSNQKRR